MSDAAAPVARLAPSPTGLLHVGHARSFLIAWWHARARGGSVVLRLEDLDVERVKPGMVDACLRDLEWLGLDWDGAPLLQSADTRPVADALALLLREGHAYPCVCSRKDVAAALSAPHAAEDAGSGRYPGTCRDRFDSREHAERESGRAAGVRLRVPAAEVRVHDALLGAGTFDVTGDVGDFLIARRDGAFAYQLAVVVDDARQSVTEVLRGDDLWASTPRQWLLQEALGLPHPTWLHVPLVVDDAGARLAKRKGDLTLAALREAGVDARTLVGWVARSCGIEASAGATAAELTGAFGLERLPRAPVVFGAAELAALVRG